MKPFLRLLKQISLFVCLLFCIQIQAQQKDSTNTQLSIKVAMVVPAFYGFNATIFGLNGGHGSLTPDEAAYTSIPDFKLSYVAGLQYKSKRNLLIETMF